MLPEKEYFMFSKKVSKLLKTCFLRAVHSEDEPFRPMQDHGISAEETSAFKGKSSLTQNTRYYFNRIEALKHKEDLLEICRILPKLKAIVPDTAGTISYADLLPQGKHTTISLTKYCEHADKFIALLTINDIGYAHGDFVGTEAFKAVPIVLSYRYKDQVNPDAE